MGLTDFFKRKTHREKYNAAEKNLERKSERIWRAQNRFNRRQENNERFLYAGGGLEFDSPTEQLGRAEYFYDRAKRKLDKLYAEGHQEALELDKKYDALIAKLVKDAKEVYNFERKELGINGENERWLRKHKKNLGTMVGVFAISALIISSLNPF